MDAVLIGLIVIPLFAINGRWGSEANVDVTATTAPAWKLVEHGTLDLSEYAGQNPWLVESASGDIVSDRAPGLIASAVPGYVIWQVDRFVNGPGTLVALGATATAVIVCWWVLVPLVGQRFAFSSALVFALGTTTWAVSASQLWPHGVGQMFALLTIAFFSKAQLAAAGISSALAVAVRPIASVYAAGLGVLEGIRRRDWRPILVYGSISLLGLLVVLFYNRWLFATWTLQGGSQGGLTGGFRLRDGLFTYLENVYVMFLSPRHGFLLLSPVLAVATFGVLRWWNRIPGWARSAVLAATLYLLVHAAFNRASGGMQIFYRYPLEVIALAAPALGIGAWHVWRSGDRGRFVVLVTAAVSVTIQFVNVFYLGCLVRSPNLASCLF